MAEPDSVGDRRSGERQRAAAGEIVVGGGERLQLARGDHLGEQHGRGLEDFDLLVDVEAARLVLHDENAERVAAAQDRHP